MMDWSSVREKAAIGVISSLGTGLVIWGATATGAFVGTIFTAEVPGSAVIAFSGQCPEGWGDFDRAAGRFLVATGRNRDKNSEVRDFQVGIGDDSGEYMHKLEIPEMPNHDHEYVAMKFDNAIQGVDNTAGVSGEHHLGGGLLTKERGGGLPHNNVPPYIALTFCQKT